MINLILVLITFVTTVIAGAQWVLGYGVLDVSQLYHGLPYAFSILFMLGTHEFGHYFASLAHKVKVTLPYFIPFPSIEGFLNFGTMGAVIKTKSPIQNKTALFDIGIAGPVAGFIASIGLVIYGFSTLPGKDYILGIHPDYDTLEYGAAGVSLIFGDNILFSVLRDMFANSPDGFIPPMNEIYHYPYLCVGWFGLFVTALNLIPVGQLDGGHIMYAMFGSKVQKIVAWVFMLFMLVWGGLGILTSFYDLGFNF
ncbi:MAG: site-2 protease family protein [Ignavibacteriaceae bacterium]|nr:site-2 protease family protein [Ignavibacteriaceae bacterium]